MASLEPQIGILTADHLPAVLTIEKAAFKDPWTLTSFRDLMIQSRTNWAATLENKVAGYLMTQWVLDEIHILNIAVSADFRRNGIASAMMTFLFETGQQQNMQTVFLEVRSLERSCDYILQTIRFLDALDPQKLLSGR